MNNASAKATGAAKKPTPPSTSTQASTQANTTSAAKKTTPPSTRPSSRSGEASPTSKYIIEGTKGPSFELKSSGGKVWFQKDARAISLQKDTKKGQYYYTVADPKDAKTLRPVYLKKV
ncbi:hypothetical protein J7T55_001291 [Diaporthe amygdali]|uniref:uncharacterized protein n=1 Tax=Phomopsis amygdali TaxID=1214568 RepID=UPI0022FE656D|nr:uncharacterized protein J7T55_001291 [Diaporthe amygdali]KAJ0106767.1 hypothetical protein J7T55_001291 [Diaporthe amygdali]